MGRRKEVRHEEEEVRGAKDMLNWRRNHGRRQHKVSLSAWRSGGEGPRPPPKSLKSPVHDDIEGETEASSCLMALK